MTVTKANNSPSWYLAVVAFLLPTYLFRFEVVGIPTTFLEVLIYFVFLAGLIQLSSDQLARKRLVSRRNWLVPAGLILAGAVIGVLISTDLRTSLGLLKGFVIDPILVYILGLAFLTTQADRNRVIVGLTSSAVVVAIWALLQAYLGGETRALGPYVLDGNASPNYLAFAIAPILPLLYWQSGGQSFGYRLLSWSAIVIGLLAITASDSRAGMVASLGGLVIYTLLATKSITQSRVSSKLVVISLILGLAASWLVVRPDFTLSPTEGGRISSSNNIRWQIWEATAELASQSPLTGVGLGNFQTEFTQLTQDRVNFPEYIAPLARTPHNLFVGIWLELGLLGLAGLVLALALVGKTLFSALKANPNRAFAAALLGSWFVILAQGLVDQPLWKNDSLIMFWLLVAISLSLAQTRKDNLLG